jgi:cell filamentation protein
MLDPYAIPGTDVLRNKLGITDPEELAREEYLLTHERLAEFEQCPSTRAFDLNDLCLVHRYLFGDVYDWAGNLRTTLIGKHEYESGGRLTRFTDPEDLITRGDAIFSELRLPEEFLRESPEAFVEHITQKYNEANILHPFREGNGRALRAFFSAYAEKAGHSLQFLHISKERWVRASIEAGFGSGGMLSRVFRDVIDPMTKERFTAIEPLFDKMRREELFDWNEHYISFPAPGHTIRGLIAIPGQNVCALINDGRVEIIDTHAIGRMPDSGEEITYTEPDRAA